MKRYIVQASLLIISISFIIHGVFRGEVLVVMTKAVNICLECIGLG